MGSWNFDDSYIEEECEELIKQGELREKIQKENKNHNKKGHPFLKTVILSMGTKPNKKKTKDKSLMSWEPDLVDKKEYEPYHFEEENMEEDDFYYEDD